MQDEYVTQREFDLEVKRLDEKTELMLQRIGDKIDAQRALIQLELREHYAKTEAQISGMRADIAEMRGSINVLEANITKTNMRMDGLITFFGWVIGITGIVIAAGEIIFRFFKG